MQTAPTISGSAVTFYQAALQLLPDARITKMFRAFVEKNDTQSFLALADVGDRFRVISEDVGNEVIQRLFPGAPRIDNAYLHSLRPSRTTLHGRALHRGRPLLWGDSTRPGHVEQITCLAFSPDGILLASASKDKTISIWNRERNRHLATLNGHTDTVTSVAFSPEGTRLASASKDQTIKIWGLQDYSCFATLEGHTSRVSAVTFFPDGRQLASASSDKTIKIWNLPTNSCVNTLTGHEKGVSSIVLSPTRNLLASASSDKTIKIWNLPTNSCLNTLTGHESTVMSIALSPDEALLASASTDRTIRIWDMENGNCVATLKEHTHWVNCVAFYADRLLLSASADFTVRIWDVQSHRCLRILRGTEEKGVEQMVHSVAFSHSLHQIASGSMNGAINIWVVPFTPIGGSPFDLLPDELVRQIVQCCDISNNPGTLTTLRLVNSRFRKICDSVWNGTLKAIFPGPSNQDITRLLNPCVERWKATDRAASSVLCVASASGTTLIATGLSNGECNVWDIKQNRSLYSLASDVAIPVTGIAFSPDATQLLVVVGHTIQIRKADQETRTYAEQGIIEGLDSSNPFTCVTYSPNGTRFASGSVTGTVTLWDMEQRSRVATLEGHTDRVNCLASSPEGTRLASASSDNCIHIWNIENFKDEAILVGHTAPVHSVVFSPNESLLASASSDRTIQIWNITGDLEYLDAAAVLAVPEATLNGHTEKVNCVTFSSDGRLLVSASDDETVRIWDMRHRICLTTFHNQNVRMMNSVVFSPDGTHIIAGCSNNKIAFWGTRRLPPPSDTDPEAEQSTS